MPTFITQNLIVENGFTANTFSATTLTGGTLYGDGSNLSNVVNSITTSTGISANTSTGSITLVNTAPDQTVNLTQGSNITITGTYPNFTIASTGGSGGTFTGGTITGPTIFTSGLSANTITFTTTPTLNNSNTRILTVNSTTGDVEYRDASTIGGGGSSGSTSLGLVWAVSNNYQLI